MNINILPSSKTAILAVVSPVSTSTATQTGWVSMKDYKDVLAILVLGAMSTSAVVDAKIEQAQDSSGTGAKDITGKAIVQYTKANSDDNKIAVINIRNPELDIANNYTHIRLNIAPGGAASLLNALLIGFDASYTPSSIAAVTQVIS